MSEHLRQLEAERTKLIDYHTYLITISCFHLASQTRKSIRWINREIRRAKRRARRGK